MFDPVVDVPSSQTFKFSKDPELPLFKILPHELTQLYLQTHPVELQHLLGDSVPFSAHLH